MPTYDYKCDTNGEVVEVRHSMAEQLSTWGELCEKAGLGLGRTAADAPVRRLITGGGVVSSSTLTNPEVPSCGSGGCGGGMCGL